MSWSRWKPILRPFLLLGFVLILGSLLLFGAVKAIPGDPVLLRFKTPPPPEQIEAIRDSLGLNDPLVYQYFGYVGNFVTGDWGRSLITNRPVLEEVLDYLPATIELITLALLFGTILGVFLAISVEWSGRRALKQVATGFGALGLTIPIFWLGYLMILTFAVGLGWLPTGGRFDYRVIAPDGTGFLVLDAILSGNGEALITALRHLALPAITLGLYPAALISGTLVARLEDPRLQNLVRALQARGLPGWRIWLVHILRLMSPPVLAIIGTNLGALIGGAVLTETVFTWPGMGRYLVGAVLQRDVAIVQYALLLVVLLAFVAIQLTDLFAKSLVRSQRKEAL